MARRKEERKRRARYEKRSVIQCGRGGRRDGRIGGAPAIWNDLLFMLSVPLDGVLRCGKVESVRCAT